MKKIFLIISIIAIAMVSCKKDQNKSEIKDLNTINEESKIPVYKIKLVNLQDNPLYSNTKSGPWIRIRIGRSGCTPGWGVCNISIFGITIIQTKDNIPPLQENEIDLPIAIEKDKVYSHLLFAEDVSQYNLEELTFIVGEDLIAEDADGNIIKLFAGNYLYNPALSSFGGYEINFNTDSSI